MRVIALGRFGQRSCQAKNNIATALLENCIIRREIKIWLSIYKSILMFQLCNKFQIGSSQILFDPRIDAVI